MAKRVISQEVSPSPEGEVKRRRDERSCTPLSPSSISQAQTSVTVNALVTSLSPAKSSAKCFRGELSDNESVLPLITFDEAQRKKLEEYLLSKKTVSLRNCQVGLNKYNGKPEVIIKSFTVIEPSSMLFSVPSDLGSKVITISELNDIEEFGRVTLKAAVLRIDEAVKTSTGSTILTVWGDDVGKLESNKSYQLNRFQVHVYRGKHQVTLPTFGASVTPIDNITTIQVPSSQESDNVCLKNCSILGVQQLATVYTCVSGSCKATINAASGSNTGSCGSCGTVQKLRNPRKTAQLLVSSDDGNVWLRAYYSEVLNNILGTTSYCADDLLGASPFT